MNEYEEYVKPPSYSYINNERDQEVDPLIKKLKVRIHQDLNQINGVYDCQISECDKDKLKKQKQLDLEHTIKIDHINNKRKIEISLYNEKAEHHINNLISSMNKSAKEITSWWDYFMR